MEEQKKTIKMKQ